MGASRIEDPQRNAIIVHISMEKRRAREEIQNPECRSGSGLGSVLEMS
ncbi:hypothetical protein [Methylobacterium oxalidis]|nr:hypothetical protein [Methylobacterium oxalidis]